MINVRSLLIILSLLIFFNSAFVQAQELKNLIPYPKNVSEESGVFELNSHLTIHAVKNSLGDFDFLAQNLAEEIKSDLGFDPIIKASSLKGGICFILLDPKAVIPGMLKAKLKLIPENARSEAYILQIKPGNVEIVAYEDAGLFYGIQTLKQLLRSNRVGNTLPCMTITDWPSLRYRGWMDDISRGPIPTVDFVKKCIRTMAEYKQNYFTLYTEHTFRLDKYPDIAPPGSFTAAEIRELSDYAAHYHMDMVGNFQSFGHMEKILGNPFYAHLRENGNILNPADEDTYRFLADVYAEVAPVYKSPFFNINCDETQGLGEGKSKAMADSIGISGIYAYHISRVHQLLKPYGKRLMMWGDIAVENREIIGQLPQDLIILSWGYGAEDSFDNAILPFKSTGFDFMVAPGVSCWNELWPAMGNAVVNISNYVRDGAKLGSMGMMNTAWDDNGHNLFNYNWHGLVWGAECSWNPAAPLTGPEADLDRNNKLSRFNEAFDALFFGTPGITQQLFLIDSLRFAGVKGILSEGAFWQNILDFYPANTNEEAFESNTKILNRADQIRERLLSLKSNVTGNTAMIEGALLALDRIRFSAQKNISRKLIYDAFMSGSTIQVAKARAAMGDLLPELYAVKKEYIRLWNAENRAWWLDKNLNDYNKLASFILEADQKVFIEPLPLVRNEKRAVTLRTLFNDKTILVTLDGSVPSVNSTVVTDTLWLAENTIIRACVLESSGIGKVTEKDVMMHKGIGHLKKLNSRWSTYNPAYAAGGEQALLDGLKGSDSFADGRWQGYQGEDLDIELDFGQIIPVRSLSCDFLQSSYSWILLPEEVRIMTSEDGITYQLVKTISHQVPQQDQKLLIHTFRADFDTLKSRFIRVIAKNPGVLPPWHHASGNPSFIFCDELIIR